jgi:PhnB protein
MNDGLDGALLRLGDEGSRRGWMRAAHHFLEERCPVTNPQTREPLRTTIAPNLVVSNGLDAIEFYKAAFDAVELHRVGDDAGVAQLSVGGAELWIAAGESAELRRFTPASLAGRSVTMIMTVEDPDAVWERAVRAGATPEAPVYEEHGWRLGSIIDPFGHRWEIGRPLGSWPPGR